MQVSDIAHHTPLGKSDHNVITFKFNCYLDYSKPKDKYAYKRADFEAMRRDLVNTNWQEQFIVSGKDMSIEDIWNTLKSKLLDLRDKFVPKQNCSGKPSWKEMGSFPINKPLQDAIRNKHSTHRHWMSTRSCGDVEVARLQYTRVGGECRHHRTFCIPTFVSARVCLIP